MLIRKRVQLLFMLLVGIYVVLLSASDANSKDNQENSQHTNNWAVLVSTSKFWFNYRHIANTLSFYYLVKSYGIPDSNIILVCDLSFAHKNVLLLHSSLQFENPTPSIVSTRIMRLRAAVSVRSRL